MSENNYSNDVKYFLLKLYLRTESISYLIIVPLIVLYIYYFMGFSENQILLFFKFVFIVLPISLVTTLINNLIVIYPITKYFKSITHNQDVSVELYNNAFKRFLSLPYIHSIGSFFRWLFGLSMVIIPVTYFGNLSTDQIVDMWMVALINAPLGAILYFLVTELYVQNIYNQGAFPKWPNINFKLRMSFFTKLTLSQLIIVLLPFMLLLTYLLIFIAQLKIDKIFIYIRLLTIGGVGIIGAVIMSFVLSKTITSKVKIIIELLKKVGEGDLTAHPTNIIMMDEFSSINNSIYQMKENLIGVIERQKGELQDLNISLEQKVIDRTYELAKANEKLLEMDKIKSNFFANISHEIRTPLTLILSPVESALQGDYKNGVNEVFLQNIQKNAIRLLKLINNLLDFSKIEAGKMNLRVKAIDIVKIIHNYITILQSTADSKGVTVKVSSENDSIPLFLDIEKFDRIAMNVFSNALKFTDKGGKIEIRIKDDENNCYIEVEDTGVGIPTDKVETIFDRFSQVDLSSTRKYEGTGIGLSLAKELIELSGGSISVTSSYIEDHPNDHGTVFTITFPKGKEYLDGRTDVEFITGNEIDETVTDQRRFAGVREMVDLRESKTEDMEAEIKTETARLYNKNKAQSHILVVEDNPDMRDFLKSLLVEYYVVHFAVDGKDGFDKTTKLKPDLIITDVMMPNIDGYTMTKMIKEDDHLKRIPVLMLTAKADMAHKIEGLEYGADDYLTKPFNSKELMARIKTLLKTREYEKIIERRKDEIEYELEIARLLQQKLLPEIIPDVSGYRSHVIYKPMDMVGGDFYDFKANDDVIELFIADVSGHGLHGAFISMITKMAFESIRERKSTRSVFYILNDIICRSTVQSNFVTALYCIIKRDTNKLILSNAGHQPLLIYRQKNDEFIEVQSSGIPLGISKSIVLEEKEIQLAKGDRVFLYTDGLTECTDHARHQFGEDGFMTFIRANSTLSPNQFTEKLLSTLRSFSGRDKFDDDLCLIVFDVL